MDLENIKDKIETNVYHINSETKVPLHAHDDKDEIFYCIKGSGFGVLENSEMKLEKGQSFIVEAGVLHSLRSESDFYVTAHLVPSID